MMTVNERLTAMMDSGEISARSVADAALLYMSEQDVQDMAESEGLLSDDPDSQTDAGHSPYADC